MPLKDEQKVEERQVPPGGGAFDSGHTETGERAEELLGDLGFGKGFEADLSPEEKARLWQEWVDHGSEGPIEAEHDPLWGEESTRRVAQAESGQVQSVPGDEVAKKARALLR